jgi:hypothetical protein
MAEILYDMNLAEAEIGNNYEFFGNNNEKREELLNSVFKKHKVSKEKFDTSLVWYNAHLETYFKICDRVNKRYSADLDLFQKKIDEENRSLAELSRVNIFKEKGSAFLQAASRLQNFVSFKVDSIKWEHGDNLEISFDILGLDKGMKPELLYYAFCEDTILFEKEKIQSNGAFLKTMFPGADKVKQISATIYISDSIPDATIFINNFGIFQQKNIKQIQLQDTGPVILK